MSSRYIWGDLPAPVRGSIEASGKGCMCGCERRGVDWWLCQYHEGMVDGWDAAQIDSTAPEWPRTN